MRDSLVLRAGTPADAEPIAALATQVFLDTYATEGIRPDLAREAFQQYSLRAFEARLAEAQRRFILAERAQALVGFAELLCVNARSPAPEVEGAELVRLYVQPAAQGHGVGKALIREAESVAASCAAPHLWLTVWEGNARAMAFYRRAGYADVGAAQHVFEDRSYGNRVYARRI